MKIVIVGAGGLVGSEFARQLSAKHQVLPITHSQLDITELSKVRHFILSEAPLRIINCSVLGVDRCENDPQLAWAVNAEAVRNLAESANEIGAELIHISTNYVFDGKKDDKSFYSTLDLPNPINVYGKTKFAGEEFVRQIAAKHFVIRTSWVFGVGKDNFFTTVSRKLESKVKIQAINDVWASATYVKDLVARSLEIANFQQHGIYHVVNSGLCSYYDFACETARILGLSEKDLIEPVNFSQLQLRTVRPRYTPLACESSERLGLPAMRCWQDALAQYLQSL